MSLPLWIAFILYLWRIEHSPPLAGWPHLLVVNCFHFVSLTYWTQFICWVRWSAKGCELLSFCIFDVLNTVFQDKLKDIARLWIAFILYLWRIEHSRIQQNQITLLVVNCFHFVSLTYWTQLNGSLFIMILGCELLSFCIFDVLNTVLQLTTGITRMLWIAFILYLWRIEHSYICETLRSVPVVNCFHFVSLTYWTQSRAKIIITSARCELLSFCIFDVLNTVNVLSSILPFPLWIAFILYLWRIEHSHKNRLCVVGFVVNCFHFVSLTYWTQ